MKKDPLLLEPVKEGPSASIVEDDIHDPSIFENAQKEGVNKTSHNDVY